ncbi:hypothetical protein RhiirA1_484656 [Rhizophagus irregularis]|nr:hypothetical protein RhiirA1_484656 [Rhizophagus irregularis]
MGNDADMSEYAPETYITNPVIHWDAYYVEAIQKWIDGEWVSESYIGGLKEGMADIAPFGKNVPQEVQDLVNEQKQAIVDGEFAVFTGPVYDQNGEIKVAEGETLSIEDILVMDWFVKGIKGTIPE